MCKLVVPVSVNINTILSVVLIILEAECFNRSLPVFDFGNVEPLIETFDNFTAIVENQNFKVQFKCISTDNYPTQWVLDYDTISSISRNSQRNRQERTERKFKNSYLEKAYNYVALINLEYPKPLREVDTLYCKNVGESEEALKITLTPSDSRKEVLIEHQIIEWNYNHIFKDAAENNQNLTEEICPVKFYLRRYDDGKFYIKCGVVSKTSDLNQTIEMKGELELGRRCTHSEAHCSNTFRKIRVNNECISIINASRGSRNDNGDGGWTRADLIIKQPTVVVCKNKKARQRGSMAVFFSGTGKKGPRKIHVSPIDVVASRELITLNLFNDKKAYYTDGIIRGECIVPKYRFSSDPVFEVRFNGSVVIEDRYYKELDQKFEEKVWLREFKLEELNEGVYIISCIAPVWNTVEWANVNRTIIVKRTVEPYFEHATENLTFKLDDENQSIECNGKGEPEPEISWEFASFPVTKQIGNMIKFIKVTDFIAGEYICLAKNEFGQTATKTYYVFVNDSSRRQSKDNHYRIDKSTDSESSTGGLNTGTLIAVTTSVVGVIILAVIAVSVIYCKVLKLGSRIVTYLTYEEVKEFTDGSPKKASGECEVGLDHLPYNSSYEIERRDHLIYDENSILGSGAFGIVLNGKLKLYGNFIPVAVKTVKKNVEISYFKALLSELKIMAYIGNHDNIVNLLGAYTSNIKNREVFVCVELCETSLLKYLQSNKDHYRNFVKNDRLIMPNESETFNIDGDSYQNLTTVFSTFNLIRWALEISTGMEFLVSKNVIHGDLAGRNILLSKTLVSKICDFGLARQLIDYNYIKSESCPLPWKWMAIESLSEMKFSQKSDVWSFGITLWEMFSLGMNPYPGSTWSMDFVDQLRAGFRMTCPNYAPTNIYATMLETWHESPRHRPTFTDLREFFQKLIKCYG